jgi:hypothetical protein
MKIKMFKRKNNKKIIFEESSLVAKYLLDTPKPSSSFMPEWFRKDKLYSGITNNKIDFIKNNYKGTYKVCTPVTDSMTAGYSITLPAAIAVINDGTAENYIPKISWNVSWPVCDGLDSIALQNYPVPAGHHQQCFRWVGQWKIITPQGYSLWITHPSHRYDLPFTTINGFVDTDVHPNPIFLPFFIKNGFEGIIEEGTPIAQIVPVKRDLWKSEKHNYKDIPQWISESMTKIDYLNTYKRRYWFKKRYL